MGIGGEKGEGDRKLDATGYSCPYPAMLTLDALEVIRPGASLEVKVDNPPSVEAIPRKIKAKGHEVVRVEEIEGEVWRIVVKKKEKRNK